MAMILCPTRGGQASYPNQDRAIAIAKERSAGLLFLYVANVSFLDRFASPLLVDVETELEEMGEFLLAMAQERAEKAGVKAQTEVRRGRFRYAIKDVIQLYEISSLVLGTAVGQTGVTTLDYVEEVSRWILKETGVEVIIVHQGEIIEHHQLGSAGKGFA
jgi:nucleotide-binding universal stress UspA family protein